MRRNSFSGRRQFGGRTSGGSRRPSFGGRRAFSSNRRPNRMKGVSIDPAKFVRKVITIQKEAAFVAKHTFDDFKLSDKLRNNIAGYGYKIPTPIQDEGIIPISEGKDLIGLANTGTGKTAAFLLPIISKLQLTFAREAVLIIAPTRELAIQIADEFKIYAHGLNLTVAVCVGGAPIVRQIGALRRRPNVVVGTPGRLKDLINQKKLHVDKISTLVLDEADHMMDMGFLPDVRYIVNLIPKKRQTLCFSATLPPEIEKLMRELLTNPVTISVRTGNTSGNVDQNVLYGDNVSDKIHILMDLFKRPEFSKVLIFGRTKHGVQKLADSLNKGGVQTEAIHGNKSQGQRQRALQNFKDNKAQVLVATDVAARGIDIPNVSHVINFDQPNNYIDYIHRIGRTGRAGKIGKALTFVPVRTKI